MKRKFHRIGLAAALTLSPALAIEPPPDTAPPPPSVETGRPAPVAGNIDPIDASAPGQQGTEQHGMAFLGLISSNVPELLASHLGLQEGNGVVILSLVPGGPAETEGLQRHDVILKVAGQEVHSPANLSERLAEHRPGDEVEIDLIHQGQAVRKNVVLGTRPADVRTADFSSGNPDPFDSLGGFSPSQLNRLRGLVDRNLRNAELLQDLQHREMMSGGIHSHFDQTIREMQERMAEIHGDHFDVLPPDGKIQFKSDSTFRLVDDQGSIEIKSRDNDKEVIVRGEDNQIIWSGPWNSEEDKTAAPEEIRQRVEKLNLDENFQGDGLRFQFGPGFGR